jgi:xylitol oxidase
LRLVDGKGDVHALRRGNDDELINAVLVSVGACGIVTSLTLHTEPAYDVAGSERVLPDRGGAVDLFADGDAGLATYFARHDYARILWWPQRTVRRIAVWQARRIEAGDAEPRRAYQPLPTVGGSTQPLQMVGGAVLWGIVHWRRVRRWLSARAMARLEGWMAPLEGRLYRAFLDGAPQRFRGAWWEVLPQDATMDERWMPTTFTEIFVSLEQAGAVMRTLDALFATQPAAAGRFAIELYAAPASSSWLHPAYGRPSLRINIFWLMHEPDDPRDTFFPRIWDALAPFAPRLHWGKLFPHTPGSMVVDRFPRLADFVLVRKRLDPERIFLSAWLAAALGVPAESPSPTTPMPQGRRHG